MISNNDLFNGIEDLGYKPNGIDKNGLISKDHLYNVYYQKNDIFSSVAVYTDDTVETVLNRIRNK